MRAWGQFADGVGQAVEVLLVRSRRAHGRIYPLRKFIQGLRADKRRIVIPADVAVSVGNDDLLLPVDETMDIEGLHRVAILLSVIKIVPDLRFICRVYGVRDAPYRVLLRERVRARERVPFLLMDERYDAPGVLFCTTMVVRFLREAADVALEEAGDLFDNMGRWLLKIRDP